MLVHRRSRYEHPATLDLWRRKLFVQELYAPPGSRPGGGDVALAFMKRFVNGIRFGGVAFSRNPEPPALAGGVFTLE